MKEAGIFCGVIAGGRMSRPGKQGASGSNLTLGALV